jgi:predicted nucleotidyltransferase
MDVSPRQALDRLRAATQTGELDQLCERRGVRIMSVFGSTVAGAENPADLDIAVSFLPGAEANVLDLALSLLSLFGRLMTA